MIDLRSDTLTKPTPGMREAMAAAPVGDDVYGEDPTVNALEERIAGLLGQEAGLFVATGSLANMLGVWCSTRPGTEVLCDAAAHIVRAEMGGHALNHGVTTRTWASADGVADAATIEAMVAPDAGPFLVQSSCIELENTHNFGGGTVQPIETIRAIAALARDRGVALHLDGARLWNAHIATGVPLVEYGRLFDTVSVAFSKGLGAPIGSMLLSSKGNVARARVQRKRLGAGWRQAGILAAAADFAVTHQLDRLADDHAAARAFADAVRAEAPDAIPGDVPTNIVVLSTGSLAAADVARSAAERGVVVSAMGTSVLRAVTHLDVTADECREAGHVVGGLLAGAFG